jgi:rod shape-determining protein MreD
MRRFFLPLLFLLILALLQSQYVSRYINIYGVLPNFSLVFLVLLSIRYGRLGAQNIGFVSGLLQDIIVGVPLGSYALLKLLQASFWGSLRGRFLITSLITAPFLVSIATIINMLLAHLLNGIFRIQLYANGLSLAFVIEIIMNVIITFPLHFLVKWVAQIMQLPEEWQKEGVNHK